MPSAKRMSSLELYDDDDFLENLSRDDICGYHYLSMHTDRIGVLRSPKTVLKSLSFTDDEADEVLNHLIENGYIYDFDYKGKRKYLDGYFYVHNSPQNREQQSTYEVSVGELFDVRRKGDGGDGIYYRKEKKTSIDEAEQQQSTSNIGVSDDIDDSITATSQEQPVTEYAFNDDELHAVINECPQEFFDGDISSIEKALNECLKHDGLNITNIVMATNKYYNPKLKSAMEMKLGKIKMLDEFLSDSTLVLAAYHMN